MNEKENPGAGAADAGPSDVPSEPKLETLEDITKAEKRGIERLLARNGTAQTLPGL